MVFGLPSKLGKLDGYTHIMQFDDKTMIIFGAHNPETGKEWMGGTKDVILQVIIGEKKLKVDQILDRKVVDGKVITIMSNE